MLAPWMELEAILLTEIIQSPKEKLSMISLPRGP